MFVKATSINYEHKNQNNNKKRRVNWEIKRSESSTNLEDSDPRTDQQYLCFVEEPNKKGKPFKLDTSTGAGTDPSV